MSANNLPVVPIARAAQRQNEWGVQFDGSMRDRRWPGRTELSLPGREGELGAERAERPRLYHRGDITRYNQCLGNLMLTASLVAVAVVITPVVAEDFFGMITKVDMERKTLTVLKKVGDNIEIKTTDSTENSVVSQSDATLSRTALARRTFSRMSTALAVHANGLGLSLCSSM